LLPLLLWETPPGLELALAQEGVPFARVRELNPLTLQGGRFLLFDSRRMRPERVRNSLAAGQSAIDIHRFRNGEKEDPFAALIDTQAAPATWCIDGRSLTERVARVPKAVVRARLLRRLRAVVGQTGGLWARLAPYPFPYRSAFNLRVDLDEPYPEDYAQFARDRKPLEDCTTHFVSTHAYGRNRSVLRDLQGRDTQSHAHFHVVYRDTAANRRNLERAEVRLAAAGIHAVGFAAPEGRWNSGLDTVLEEKGYLYSSDFHLGYDDLPFFPWRECCFSGLLQVPIHPICEGSFLDAGVRDARVVGEYLAWVVRSKLDVGEPAFVYGHPERRLGRMPGVLQPLAEEVRGESFVWRVTLTEFARWWCWRARRAWCVVSKGEGGYEVQLDEWDASFPLGLEIVRGDHVAALPLRGPRTALRLDRLAYERRPPRPETELPVSGRVRRGLKSAARVLLDWETVTPIEDLPADTLRARLKKVLRHWRQRAGASARRTRP
jgi:hypothetical protein